MSRSTGPGAAWASPWIASGSPSKTGIAQGYYFVRYSDQEQDVARKAQTQGFFSRLFSFGGKTDAKPEQYRVLVRDNQDSSQVQVLNREGGRDGSDNAKRILSLLHQQLK